MTEAVSDIEGEEEIDEDIPEVAIAGVSVRARNVSAGMSSLDQVNMRDVFERLAIVMRTIPQFFWGAFAGALRVALDECVTRQVIRRASPELGSCSSCYPRCYSGDLRVEARSRGNKCKLVATLSTQVRGEASSTTACALHTRLPLRERVPQAEARAWTRFGSTRSEGVAVGSNGRMFSRTAGSRRGTSCSR